MELFAIFFLAWFLAGFLNNIAGLGAAMVAMPIVAPFIPMSIAVPSSTLIVLTLNLQLGWRFREHIRWGDLRYLLIGGLLGAGAGISAMQSLANDTLKAAMAVFLMGYALYALLLEKDGGNGIHIQWGLLAGFLSTLFGAAFGFNGPPLGVFTTLSGWTKDAAKGILGACFIITGTVILAGQILSGLQNAQTVSYYAVACPAVLLGGALGIRASRHMSQKTYRRIVLGVLIFAGASLLASTI